MTSHSLIFIWEFRQGLHNLRSSSFLLIILSSHSSSSLTFSSFPSLPSTRPAPIPATEPATDPLRSQPVCVHHASCANVCVPLTLPSEASGSGAAVPRPAVLVESNVQVRDVFNCFETLFCCQLTLFMSSSSLFYVVFCFCNDLCI